jgi:prenyltransferase beta subunit
LAAVRALKYCGGDLANKDKIKTFVESTFEADTGGYADVPGGKPDRIPTAIGIMAAAELQLETQPKAIAYLTKNASAFEEIRLGAAALEAAKQFPQNIVKNWLDDAVSLRNPDGSYAKPIGDARMTGSVVAWVLRIGGKLTDAERQASLTVLLNGQRDDGGFGKADAKTSDLDSCYRITRAFHLLKEKPKEVEKLRAFIAKCRNADGGYGVEPGKPSTVGATYYASIVSHWLKEAK